MKLQLGQTAVLIGFGVLVFSGVSFLNGSSVNTNSLGAYISNSIGSKNQSGNQPSGKLTKDQVLSGIKAVGDKIKASNPVSTPGMWNDLGKVAQDPSQSQATRDNALNSLITSARVSMFQIDTNAQVDNIVKQLQDPTITAERRAKLIDTLVSIGEWVDDTGAVRTAGIPTTPDPKAKLVGTLKPGGFASGLFGNNNNAASNMGETPGAHVNAQGFGGNTDINTGGYGPGGTGSTPDSPAPKSSTSGKSSNSGNSGNAGGAQGANNHNAGQTGGVGANGNPLGAGGNSQNGGSI